MGSPARCPHACAGQWWAQAAGGLAHSASTSDGESLEDALTISALASTVAHVLLEAVTDPLLDGWHSKGGGGGSGGGGGHAAGGGGGGGGQEEAGDECAWVFPGPVASAPPPGVGGAPPALASNAVVGGRAVLLQGVPDGKGGCV